MCGFKMDGIYIKTTVVWILGAAESIKNLAFYQGLPVKEILSSVMIVSV